MRALQQFFRRREASKHLDNTEGFESDPSIRIVVNPEDLVVIHHPDVKALLWKRTVSDDIVQELEALQNTGRQSQALQVEESHYVNMMRSVEIPPAIKSHIQESHSAFEKAAGARYMAKVDYYGNGQYGADRPSAMHVDDNITLRALAVYTLDLNAASEWYPGRFSRDDINRINLQLLCAQSDEEKRDIKESYGVQTLNLGDVLIFKGKNYDGKLESEDQIAHNGRDGTYDGAFRYLTI